MKTIIICLLTLSVFLIFSVQAQDDRPTLNAIWFQWDPCTAFRDQWAPTYPDAIVNVTCVPIGDWYNTIWEDFSREQPVYDLVILDSQNIGEAVVDDHIIDITEFIEEKLDVEDYYAEPFAAYGEFPPGSKRFYGIPFEADVQLLIYREDVWGDAGVDDVFSWSELLEVSAEISARTGLGYTSFWCTDAERCYDQGATVINQMMWSFGGDLWDPSSYQIDGILQSPENQAALDLARELASLNPNEASECDFGCAISNLCEGRAHALNIWAGFGPTFLSTESCAQADRLKFSIVPGQLDHALSLGGMGIHVNAHISLERQQHALDFVEWQMSREQQRNWARFGGYSARKSVLATGLFLNSAEYAPAFAVSYPLVRDFWNIPEYAQMLPIQMKYLGEALRGERTSRDALNRIAQEQQAILDAAYPDGPPRPPMDRVNIDDAVLITFLVIAGILMLLGLVIGLYVFLNRTEPVFRYSSPFFLLWTLFGVEMLLASLFTFAEDPVTTGSCQIHLWLSVIGVCFIFAPLFAKTWRIYRVFASAEKFTTVNISQTDVIVATSIISLPLVLLLAIWTGVDTNEPVKAYDDLDDDEFVIKCDNDNLGIYLGVLFGYFGIFLICGLYLSFVTRKIKGYLSESSHISLILVNMTVMSAIVLPLIFFISDDPTVKFLLESIGYIYASALVIGLLFVYKTYVHITRGDSVDPVSGTMSRTTSSGSGRANLPTRQTAGTLASTSDE